MPPTPVVFFYNSFDGVDWLKKYISVHLWILNIPVLFVYSFRFTLEAPDKDKNRKNRAYLSNFDLGWSYPYVTDIPLFYKPIDAYESALNYTFSPDINEEFNRRKGKVFFMVSNCGSLPQGAAYRARLIRDLLHSGLADSYAKCHHSDVRLFSKPGIFIIGSRKKLPKRIFHFLWPKKDKNFNLKFFLDNYICHL